MDEATLCETNSADAKWQNYVYRYTPAQHNVAQYAKKIYAIKGKANE
jgi:hypothetical protein